MYLCMYVCMYISMYVRMYVCMFVCIYHFKTKANIFFKINYTALISRTDTMFGVYMFRRLFVNCHKTVVIMPSEYG